VDVSTQRMCIYGYVEAQVDVDVDKDMHLLRRGEIGACVRALVCVHLMRACMCRSHRCTDNVCAHVAHGYTYKDADVCT
jgi:hypothetical protein